MDKIGVLSNNSSLNPIHTKGGNIGIVTSGSAYNYVMDVVEENDSPVNVLKITFSYPFPEKEFMNFWKMWKGFWL